MKKPHEYYMQRAIDLALKGRGKVSPNPMVGSLLVRNSRIIAEGYHRACGLDHAEVMVLNEAQEKAKGATLYVTLEPCTHFGRTPPCVDRVLRSGVKEVVIGMVDPNPVNNGKGIKVLRENGIKVHVGILEDKVKKLNEVFIKYITRKAPFVTLKLAESLDGKIATRTGDSKWITSDESRAYAHRIRKDYDAIMVGVNTVLRDNPMLEAWFSKGQPVKIVVDSRLSTPQSANIFSRGRKAIIVTLKPSAGEETENRQMLVKKADILDVCEKDGQVNLRDMMKKLAQRGIANVLVEGGGTLAGALLDEGLVDKVMFFISPKIIGGKDAISSVMGRGVSRVDKCFKLKDLNYRRIGDDLLVSAYIR